MTTVYMFVQNEFHYATGDKLVCHVKHTPVVSVTSVIDLSTGNELWNEKCSFNPETGAIILDTAPLKGKRISVAYTYERTIYGKYVDFKNIYDILDDMALAIKERNPQFKTDFASTNIILLEPVALELSALWHLSQIVSNNAFVVTASGDALDKKGLEFGLTRRPASKSTVDVVFYRATGVSGDITIPKGTRVRTISKSGEEPIIFETTDEYVLRDSENQIVIPCECTEEGSKGNVAPSTLIVLDSPIFGIGSVDNPEFVEREETFTYSSDEDSYLLEREFYEIISVEGVRNGAPYSFERYTDFDIVNNYLVWLEDGNKPDDGTDFVVRYQYYNRASGGSEEESDDDFRERILRAIETKARATHNAIKYAVLSIPGIKSVKINDMARGVGTIDVVFIAQGNATPGWMIKAVEQVVNDYRACGIHALVKPATKLFVDAQLKIKVKSGYETQFDSISQEVEEKIRTWFDSLDIGQKLVCNEFIRLSLEHALVEESDLISVQVLSDTYGPNDEITPNSDEIFVLRSLTIEQEV